MRYHIINDSPLYYTEEMLEYISSLLSSANEIELKDEKQIISYYLYSLFSSYIKSETYIDNSENIDSFKKI